MIGPLPHTGPMPPEGRGDSADQQHGQAPSDLFAQLLGAGGALAAEQAALAEAPSMPAPEASLLVPDVVGADPAQQAPAPLARVFNQDGFFGHAGKIPGQAVMLEREEAALAQAPGVAPAGLAAALRPEVAFPAIPGGSTMARSGAGHGPAMRVARAGPATVVAKPASGMAAAPPATAENEAADPVAPLRHRAYRTPGAARSALHVALHEIESGLQIAARVEGLDEAERHQLRDEIAALLGRHGLSAARIQINAMPPRESER
ncbi:MULTISPECIES: hypothetical protein [unclassified Sphingomonas]|uniref:hypothetical protein n=1 Tax=Sphingomonas TaxID=13687 RepID=UPI000B238348|nr:MULTISPECIES: hypothetical protein [unclassified Sphingomonas]MBN8811094.1 hypothetical protein [Sphingomonas sp.]